MRSSVPALSGLALLLALGCATGGEGPGSSSMLLGGGVSAGALQSGTADSEHGRLRLRCDPADAEVLVNGVTQGLASDFAAPESLRLEPGYHRIEVRKEGFMTFRAEVVIAAQVLETIPITLQRIRSLEERAPEVDEAPEDEET